jgi:membrane protease YdiL (CAAX protease family)
VFEWIVTLLIGVGLTLVTYFIAFSLLMITSKKVKSIGSALEKRSWISNIIIGPIILVLSLLIIYVLSQGNIHQWGFQWMDLWELSWLILVGGIIAIFTVGMAEILSPSPPEMKPLPDPRSRVLFFILIVILASISEELLFRGFLQGILDNTLLLEIEFGNLSLTGGSIVSAIIFAVVHVMPAKRMGMNPVVLMGSSFILGIISGVALATTGSLIAPIIIHSLFNLVGFLESVTYTSKNNPQ